ncbi:MAG: hypothetical protein RL213_2256 [Bacteroidota bacterium]
MTPFFSIIVPTYQRRYIVTATILNVLEQSFADFEIILVDDGSTDGTKDHLELVFSGESRLKIVSQENSERGAARNTGMKAASGEYLVFMDSDDRLERDHLSVLHHYALREKKPDFLTTKFDFLRDGRHIPTAIGRLKEGYYDYRVLLRGNILGMYLCVRRENPSLVPFENDRGFSILEDWMFNLANLRKGRIFVIDKTTYHLVDHADRSMRADQGIVARRMDRAVAWILKNIPFEESEKRIVSGYAAYFSAANFLQAGERSESFRRLKKAIHATGFRFSYLPLVIRLVVSYQPFKRKEKEV